MLLTKDNLDEKLDEKLKEFYELKVEEKALPRMLFLDDRTKRIEAALKQYAGKYDLTIVTNTKECLRYLCRQEYDIVSLDHDLNGDDFQNPDDVTSGMEVVRYIVRCGGFPPTQLIVPEVWIHSSNLFAANLMITELLKVGIPAYFRKFEYDEEKKSSWAAEVMKKHKPVEDKWDSLTGFWKCVSCGRPNTPVNQYYQCHDCYKREMKQCEG